MTDKKEWYEIWFNSPYYHILYDQRDEKESEYFVNNIIKHFSFLKDAKVLDLACGSGRFSYQLFRCGCQVWGMDISSENILLAKKKFASSPISFIQGDMLLPFPKKGFDMVFNFFTSFGYFDKIKMLNVLKNIHACLKPNGYLLIDYINTEKALKELIAKEMIEKENIKFFIERRLDENFIVKHIHIMDDHLGIEQSFSEKVFNLSLNHFTQLFHLSSFEIKYIFGDYHLSSFDEKNSGRLILVARKL